MADFYIDQNTGLMEVNGGKVREVSDPIEEVKQRALIAVQTQSGEWLYDTTAGLPWTDEILIKGVRTGQVASRVQAYLLTVEGITGCTDVRVTLADRQLTITCIIEILETVTAPFNATAAVT